MGDGRLGNVRGSINRQTYYYTQTETYAPNRAFTTSPFGNLNDELTRKSKILKFKRKPKKNTTADLVKNGIFIAMAAFFVFAVFPFSHNNFVAPIFRTVSAEENLKYAEMYEPTAKYLTNSVFLDDNYLRGSETKKPIMKELKLTKPIKSLENDLKNLEAMYPNVHPSVFVWDVSNGRYAALNAEERFPAASIIKIPVLLQLFRSIEAGQLSVEDEMTLTDYYRAEGSGDLQFQRTGNTYSVDSLARKMIEISDNSSTNMLMASCGGMKDINRAVKNWGLKSTEINNWLPDMQGTNVTSTKDLARMLYNIENTDFLSKKSKERIFDYMGHVKNSRLLKAGLPDGAKLYHKTGDIGHMLGDAGIVVTPNNHKYIVAIVAKRPYNHPAGKDFIVAASSLIYKTMSSQAE